MRSDSPPLAADRAVAARVLQDEVAADQLRMVMAHTAFGALVATAFAILLATHLYGRIEPSWVIAWIAAKLVVVAPRVVASQLYRRRPSVDTHAWQRWNEWLLAADGAVWGLAGAALMGRPTDIVAEVAASLFGIAAVATFGLQVRMTTTLAYVGPMLAPTAAALYWRGDDVGFFAGSGLLLFLALVLSTSHRSERRLAEVFTLRLEMSRVAAERTAALELAQQQSAAKTRFFSAMSHELRTPLHGILGLTRVTRGLHPDAQLQHRLALIEHSGEHLLQLINDLLDLSRLEAGRVEVETAEFDLAAELHEIVDIYAVRTEEKGLEFSARIGLAEEHRVCGDARRLRQILHNLLGNALKFTAEGAIHLRVAALAGDEIEFEVRDTGPGIAPEAVPHIFDAFWQTGDAKLRHAGSGLGLHISMELARAMKGTLVCESRPGQGSSFTLRVPLPAAEERHGLTRHVSGWMIGDLGRPLGRVLLAEDNEVNALVAQAMLARHGWEVVRVEDGAQALAEATAADRPDLVLMDCLMPGMDGFEATRRIRDWERRQGRPPIPIVALTANSGTTDRKRCEAAGMTGFLGKPFDESELLAALDAVFAPAFA
jgi:signal transduction histidine kinase/ActR/RegA family two-component response regulator